MKKTEPAAEQGRLLRSRCNICEEEGNIILKMEMPGVKKENLDLQVDNNELTIRGRREPAGGKGEYIIRERKDGDYYQSYTIDNTIDKEKIDAVLDSGILTLTLRIKEAEKPKRIEVKAV